MASSSGTSSKAQGLLKAAFDGNLRHLKKFAQELDDGKGLTKTIASVRDEDSGKSALHYAALKGNTDICNYLINDLKLDVDLQNVKQGGTPLHSASLGGNFSTAAFLLNKGANPRATEDDGSTALHYAAAIGHEELVNLLLSKGVDVDGSSYYRSPLLEAADKGKNGVVKILLDHHANPNLSFYGGFTPLLTAIEANAMECMKLLLEAGADPNRGAFTTTPLLLATSKGHTDMLKCLLEAGADPNVTNADGLKPVEIAALNSNHQGLQILFPMTSPIQTCSLWSIGGIMNHVHSEQARVQRELKQKDGLEKAKSKGDDAFREGNYCAAICYYALAMIANPLDATLLSNRSLCWARLKNGGSALSDAMTCISMKPDWPKAYYRAGAAWNILKEFDEAAEAFLKGLKLDPKNEELQNAYNFSL